MSAIRKIAVLDIAFGILAFVSKIFEIDAIRDVTNSMHTEISRFVNFLVYILEYSPYISFLLLIFTGILLVGYRVVLR